MPNQGNLAGPNLQLNFEYSVVLFRISLINKRTKQMLGTWMNRFSPLSICKQANKEEWLGRNYRNRCSNKKWPNSSVMRMESEAWIVLLMVYLLGVVTKGQGKLKNWLYRNFYFQFSKWNFHGPFQDHNSNFYWYCRILNKFC